MKTSRTRLLLVLFCWLLAGVSPARAAPPLQRGVALGLFSEDPLWSYKGLLQEIKDLGASHVSLTVGYYQEDGQSTELFLHPRFTSPDAAVLRTVQEAHALGLKVMLFPIVRLAHPRDGEWRGTLQPRDRAAWWRSYKQLMLHLAELSARAGVEMFAVGSELSTLDMASERPRWQELVAAIRKLYQGQLTYSGNWDHFEKVALYDLVDFAGLSVYFPLASRLDPAPAPLDTLVAAWQKKRAELTAFAARAGRPLIFTEVGYLSQRGAAAWPWDEGSRAPVDLEDQRRCYQAFAQAWSGAPILRGTYFWNWYGWGGRASIGYTPRHKPAAQEIERYFATESARPAE